MTTTQQAPLPSGDPYDMEASGAIEPGRVGSRDMIEATRPTPEAMRVSNPLEGGDVMLAPLCGITDAIFRKICLDRGASMVVTEMISAEGLTRNSGSVRATRNLDMTDGPLSLQLFGSSPERMGEAAEILSELEPRFVDMNFGCPVRKIVSKNGGSAVLKDLKLLNRICREVADRSTVPVSAKIRSGWDRPTAGYLRDIGHAIEDAGVSMVAIHARTKKQAFKGKANWELIRGIKEAVSIPVIGNGDVTGVEDYFNIRRETGCDGVMIGRGAIGNPWVFEEIRSAIDGREYTPPTAGERVRVMLEHVRLTVNVLGEPTGLIVNRKIMGAYLKRLPNSRELRGKLMKCERMDAMEELCADYLTRLDDDRVPPFDKAPVEAAC